MKSQKSILAIAAALLFGASGLFAQTTSGGTTSSTGTTGSTSTGSTTGSTSTTGGTTTGSTSMGGTTTGSTSMGGGMGKHGHVVNPNSSAVAQAVQTILAKFDANRDQYMTERKALLDKLAAATTEADRQAILAQLKADLQTEKDQRAQLGKEIRDELKTMRQQRKAGG